MLLTLEELHRLEPLAEVSELRPDSRYVVRMPAGDDPIKATDRAEELNAWLKRNGISAVIVVGEKIVFWEREKTPNASDK
jgi:hypothetical protein